MIKRISTLFFLLFIYCGLFAQNSYAQNYSSEKSSSNYKSNRKKTINFNGQWKGSFNETIPSNLNYGGNTTEYVLELKTEGSQVSGYSYTYFNEGPKRYYTICRLTGSLNRQTNEIVVTEVERIKFNTPPNISNCFQIHRLKYSKDTGNTEVLRGTWVSAPDQVAGCAGSGTTFLSRRIVSNLPTGFMLHKSNPIAKAPVRKPTPKKVIVTPKKVNPPIAKSHPAPQTQKTEPIKSSVPQDEKHEISKAEIKSTPPISKTFQNRRKDIVKTITIEQPTFHLDFYDNGEIDGDSISVFYNGKIVLSHQKLSDKPISLTLALDKGATENIITMYADNLGTIPPNTALMIVTDGKKRYEVRIESDTEKSGSVIFQPSK
jgi:hypothetical protein